MTEPAVTRPRAIVGASHTRSPAATRAADERGQALMLMLGADARGRRWRGAARRDRRRARRPAGASRRRRSGRAGGRGGDARRAAAALRARRAGPRRCQPAPPRAPGLPRAGAARGDRDRAAQRRAPHRRRVSRRVGAGADAHRRDDHRPDGRRGAGGRRRRSVRSPRWRRSRCRPPAATCRASTAARSPQRQGKRMRPDVALAFDRMSAAARADGVALIITSAFRTNAEQAALFAAHPDPKWVAPPGTVAAPARHRARPRPRRRRTAGWRPTPSASASCSGTRGSPGTTGSRAPPARAASASGPATAAAACRPFVPERWAPAISRAAQRWNVGAALLAAQLWQESHFNPFAQLQRRGAGHRAVHARTRPRPTT